MPLTKALHDLLTPAPLRLPQPAWPEGLTDALRALAESLRWEAIRGPQHAQPQDDLPVDALADLATSLWRLRRRLVGGPGGTSPRQGLEREFYHLQAAVAALARAGVEARDHDGMLFSDHGSDALDPIAFQPTAGLDRQRVIQTVEPTIFVRGQWARMGKVIVGVPENES